MKNRMRESRSFGSVRGEGGNVLAYSEVSVHCSTLWRCNRCQTVSEGLAPGSTAGGCDCDAWAVEGSVMT